VDAFFSLEIYDYQQNAGIRLVAKRLDVHFWRDHAKFYPPITIKQALAPTLATLASINSSRSCVQCTCGHISTQD
jgi:hypothetical protein